VDSQPTSPRRAVHELVSELDYPMFIVTVAGRRERAGCLIGFATQCSIDPPRFLVCLSDKNKTFRVAREASVMVVHMVPSDAGELARLFGEQTGDEVDKFARCEWSPGPDGTPVLNDCRNLFAARIVERIDAGDHWAFVLDPFEGASDRRQSQFDFHRAKRMEPGHEP
jgi:flavin reductase (DIM6/NTAB) family NADH-FMN oxidoreductase RutF